jgi:hypothetical protein
VPDDRIIDGMDMRDFLLGDAEQSGRDIILHLQGNRLRRKLGERSRRG